MTDFPRMHERYENKNGYKDFVCDSKIGPKS